MKYIFTCLTLLIFFVAASPSSINQDANPAGGHGGAKPNIVLFIADDLGINDIGPYGNRGVKTPNLDRLSHESLFFSRAFAGSVFSFGRLAKTNVPEPGFEQKPGLNYDLNMTQVDRWLSEQKKGQPFLLIVADHSPHVVWPDKSSYNPTDIDVPPVHIDTEETRKSRARYYEDVSKMDGNVGRLLESLERKHLDKNTVFVFTADQGPQWPFAKWSLYDDGIQVPL